MSIKLLIIAIATLSLIIQNAEAFRKRYMCFDEEKRTTVQRKIILTQEYLLHEDCRDLCWLTTSCLAYTHSGERNRCEILGQELSNSEKKGSYVIYERCNATIFDIPSTENCKRFVLEGGARCDMGDYFLEWRCPRNYSMVAISDTVAPIYASYMTEESNNFIMRSYDDEYMTLLNDSHTTIRCAQFDLAYPACYDTMPVVEHAKVTPTTIICNDPSHTLYWSRKNKPAESRGSIVCAKTGWEVVENGHQIAWPSWIECSA